MILIYFLLLPHLIYGLLAESENVTSTSSPEELLKRGKIRLKSSLDTGKIPMKLIPFLNITAVEEGQKQNNGSLDFIIRDEDVTDQDDEQITVDPAVLNINEVYHDGNKTVVKISEEATYQLMQKWADQAASGLLSAVMNKKIHDKRLNHGDKMFHNNCTKNATSVTEHARCVVVVLNRLDDQRRRLRKFKKLRFRRHRRHQKHQRRRKRSIKEPVSAESFNVKSRKNYALKEKEDVISPFSNIARSLITLIQEKKNENRKGKRRAPPKKWQTVIQEIKEEMERVKAKKKDRQEFRKKFAKYSRAMKSLGIDPRQGFQQIGMESIGEEISEASEPDEKLSEEEKMMKKPLMMIRDGVKLGMMLAGKNVSNFDERKIALISPQFLSVLPDDKGNDTINLLSPSVLALHEQGTDMEKLLSLSRAMKFLSQNGHDDWMNFVLEASGVTEAVEKLRTNEQKEEVEAFKKHFSNEKGQQMYFTKENVTEMYGDYEASKIDSMDALHKSMSAQQMHEMNTTGYAVMTDTQITQFYGPGSPYNDSYAFNSYRKLKRDEIPHLLEHNIHMMANEKRAFEVSRRKDITLSPILFTWIALAPATASQPIILSPLVFSPLVLSPSALGPLIVSPFIFSPLILSPRVLAPLILAPTIFSPIILSPLALSPLILTPAVADPLILSPFVLTPFILSPLVMVPVILNPFCLSPFLGVPNTLSPLILSPFVLSPLILSPPIVNAFVLSPYVLSPIVWSDGYLFSAVLSPSFLSSV